MFEWQTKDTLEGLSRDMLALTEVRPINHFSGFHTFYPTFASGKGAAPFKTLADYENNLKRHKDFVVYLDRAIGRFREGMAAGVVETKLTVRNIDRAARPAARAEARGLALLRPGQAVPGAISRRPTRRG